MKATVYTGLACTWCDRVKSLLKDNDYEIEEIMVNKTILEELQTKYDKVIRTVPQVIIDDIFYRRISRSRRPNERHYFCK